MSLSEQQIAERHTGLGGSDAAPALGLSPYKSALELFIEKRERREPDASALASLQWGHRLEPVIRQAYAEQTHRVVRLPTGTLRHPKHAFMLAHLDGVTDDARVFEAKTSRSADGWGKPGTDEVPHHYLIQVQHYLAVTGFVFADIAVLIGGNDFRIYTVPADEELQDMVIDAEADFWKGVQNGVAPEPDFDRADVIEMMRRLYPGTDGRTIIATEDDMANRNVMLRAQAAIREGQQIADSAKAQLLATMGTASRLIFPAEGAQLQRKEVQRKEYTVPASTYIDARFAKLKETA